jgi:hypothetical protein
MGNLKFEIDAQAMAAEFKEAQKEVEAALTKGIQALAQQTHAKTVELANQRLKGLRDTYLNALNFEEVSSGIWVVSLDEKALFIEEGMKPHSMVPDLLRKNAKISKDGKKYKVIPFKHMNQTGAPSEVSKKSKEFVNYLKQELKARSIPYKKIELDSNGSPRTGKLHTFSVDSPKPTAKARYPIFHGVNIYQTKTSNGNVRRDIMTFRVVTEDHEWEDRWFSPGMVAKNLMDEAFNQSVQEWETTILPDILKSFK